MSSDHLKQLLRWLHHHAHTQINQLHGDTSMMMILIIMIFAGAILLVDGMGSPSQGAFNASVGPQPTRSTVYDPNYLAFRTVQIQHNGITTPTPTPDPNVPTPTPFGGVPPTATPVIIVQQPTSTPAPTFPPPTGSTSLGMWVSQTELASLPTSGTAWTALKAVADGNLGSAAISNQDSTHDTNTLAVALVYGKTHDPSYRTKAATAIMSAIGTERGGRVLAEARNLTSYVIAADLIDLKSLNASQDQQFRTWITSVRNEQMTECDTLILCHERRPNNWGTHAGAAREAIDIYIGDSADLAKAAQVFKGWLGDRASYAGFQYGDLSWQCDQNAPVGINPKGCTKSGNNLDGVIPDDQRRGGSYTWPPFKENYVYEALQGASVQARLLSRKGYDTWNWSDKAILRAYQWLYTVDNFPATGDDAFQIPIIDKAYGTNFSVSSPVGNGKNMGYTDWMLGF